MFVEPISALLPMMGYMLILGPIEEIGWRGFMPFFAGSVACSLTLTVFFNQARGSILLAMLFHFQMNNPLWPDAQPYDMYVYVATASVIAWLNRRALFSTTDAVTEVVPSSMIRPAGTA